MTFGVSADGGRLSGHQPGTVFVQLGNLVLAALPLNDS